MGPSLSIQKKKINKFHPGAWFGLALFYCIGGILHSGLEFYLVVRLLGVLHSFRILWLSFLIPQ